MWSTSAAPTSSDEAWIEHLTKDLGISRIAILYQDDAFGLAGLEGVQRALSKRNMYLVASGSFMRNTTAVKTALLDIMKGRPEAVVTVWTPISRSPNSSSWRGRSKSTQYS